ncbi:hypothetical protein CDIK_2949 [Cucumispora dikerogammari]|nr:hypothetical protein CDIK_2949 [Cucumispora dikerogammari]
MDEIRSLCELKKKYGETETIPIDVINRFLEYAYVQGKMKREVGVSEPLVFSAVEEIVYFKSENKQKQIEDEEAVFNKYDDTRLDQARSNLHELWSSYEDERQKEIQFLTFRIKKTKDSVMLFSKITKLTGIIMCVISTWACLEYRQNPV